MEYLEMVELIREELIQMVNRKCDSLIQMYQNQGQVVNSGLRLMECELAWSVPATLKGKKPVAVKFDSGENVETPTWKSVVQTIMQHCNANPSMHESLMQLRGKVAGRQRVILGKYEEQMDVPIKIDEELYFEGKFDIEVLLTMMTKKVLEPIGFDYSHIIIQYAERVPVMSEVNEEEQGIEMVQGL